MLVLFMTIYYSVKVLFCCLIYVIMECKIIIVGMYKLICRAAHTLQGRFIMISKKITGPFQLSELLYHKVVFFWYFVAKLNWSKMSYC